MANRAEELSVPGVVFIAKPPGVEQVPVGRWHELFVGVEPVTPPEPIAEVIRAIREHGEE